MAALIGAGDDTWTIQALLGHPGVCMTMRCAHALLHGALVYGAGARAMADGTRDA